MIFSDVAVIPLIKIACQCLCVTDNNCTGVTDE